MLRSQGALSEPIFPAPVSVSPSANSNIWNYCRPISFRTKTKMAYVFVRTLSPWILIQWSALIVIVHTTASSLNSDEINSIIYRVDILEKPVLNDQVQTGSVMNIVSKYGQKYRCNLPEIPNSKEDTKLHDDSGSPTYRPSLSDIGILLKPLETGPCLVKTKDWWTYEFCYGKHIKQYHLEDNKIVSPVIVLGAYHSEYDWKNKSKEDETSRNRLQRYHSQYYLNGSKCEVTGILRKAEVRFLCEDGAGDYISQVEEPESCRYIITVRTTRVCHHPYLRPPPTNTPRLITCNPILTSEQYELFHKQEEEEKELFEERRKAWLSKQEERLVELKGLNDEHESGQEEALIDDNSDTEDAEDKTGIRKHFEVSEEPVTLPTSHLYLESGEKQPEDDETTEATDGESQLLSVEKLVERLQVLGKVLEDKMESDDQPDAEDSDDPNKEATFSKLVTTLTQLLQQLDKAEQDLNNANEALWNLQNTIQNQEQSRKEITSTEELKIDQSEEVVTQKTGLQMEPATSEELDKAQKTSLNLKNTLRLKVKKLTPEMKKVLRVKSGDVQEKEDKELSDIQEALRDHLKQSGMDTIGKKVEVKIITSAYLDEDKDEFHFLNEEESSQLQSVLIKLLAGNEEAAEQVQRQKMLEKNYKFVWKDKKETNFMTSFDEEEED